MSTDVHKAWREVGYLEFDRYLREYPRPLVADPPLNRPARIREWFDVALGTWPNNAVAKQLDVENHSYFVQPLTTKTYADARALREEDSSGTTCQG